jgi:hypothetical protein
MNELLIVSNFAMLPSIVYTGYRMYKDKRMYLLELVTFFALMVVSATYHIYDIYQLDRTVFWNLYRWDRILAFQAVSSCMIHILDVRPFPKIVLWSLDLVVVTWTQYTYSPYGDNFLGLGVTTAWNFLLIVGKYKLITRKKWGEFFEHHDLIDFLFTIFYIATGITFFVLSNTYPVEYWWMHSLWHVLIFFATWTALDMKEPGVSMFCIRRKKWNPIAVV